MGSQEKSQQARRNEKENYNSCWRQLPVLVSTVKSCSTGTCRRIHLMVIQKPSGRHKQKRLESQKAEEEHEMKHNLQEEARRQINPRDGWIPEEPGTRCCAHVVCVDTTG